MHRLQGIARVESPKDDLLDVVSDAGGPLAQLTEGCEVVKRRRLGQEILIGQPRAKGDDVRCGSVDEVSDGVVRVVKHLVDVIQFKEYHQLHSK